MRGWGWKVSRFRLGLMSGIAFSFLATASAFASVIPGPEKAVWTLELSGFSAWQGRNDAAIPGNTGTRFSLLDAVDSQLFGFSIEPTWTFSERHQLRGVFAPLKLEDTGTFQQNISFQGATITAGSPADVVYQFNSYRLTYRYGFLLTEKWSLLGGFTGKIRDARISLRQGTQFGEKKDFGFVPLLHGAAAYRFVPDWQLELEFDALAAPQGRAEDLRVGLRKRWADSGLSASAFYRILEGGADNDEVYTFSLIHYAGASLAIQF